MGFRLMTIPLIEQGKHHQLSERMKQSAKDPIFHRGLAKKININLDVFQKNGF